MNVIKMVTQGNSKGGVNEPPTTPCPPAPKPYFKHISNCGCGKPISSSRVMVQLCENGVPVNKYIQMEKSMYDKIIKAVKV